MRKFSQSLSVLLFTAVLSIGLLPILAQASSANELTIVRSDTFGWGGSTVIAGEDDLTFLEFTLTNNSDEEVQITEVASKNYGNGNAQPFSNFTFALFLNGEQQGSAENPNQSGWSYFDISASNITIDSHVSREFTLVMDTVEASAPGTIQTNIANVTAERVATGNPIFTYKGSTKLSSVNQLYGPYYKLKTSGTLTVTRDEIIAGRVLVGGESNAEVLKLRFSAVDDEILIKDIHLENDLDGNGTPDNTGIQNRVDFKLYNEAGQLIQTETMVGGVLHFDLSPQDAIQVREGGSTIVTVKVDVRAISRAEQTGKRLLLALDADSSQNNYKGLEAITAATGASIATPANGWGDAEGQEFIAHRTALEINHAGQQPYFSGPSMNPRQAYRFTTLANSHPAKLGRVTLLLNVAGIQKSGGNFVADDFAVYPMVNGVADMQANIASTSVQNATPTSAKLTIEFNDENFVAGQLKTYALFVDNTVNDGAGISNDDAFVSSFEYDAAYSAPATRANQNGSVVWSDKSDPAHTDNTSDWLNGYLLNVNMNTQTNSD